MIVYLVDGFTQVQEDDHVNWKSYLMEQKMLVPLLPMTKVTTTPAQVSLSKMTLPSQPYPSDREIYTWRPYSRIKVVNELLATVKKRLLGARIKRGELAIIVSGQEWLWAIMGGQLRPNCFLEDRSAARLSLNQGGCIYSLYPNGPILIFLPAGLKMPLGGLLSKLGEGDKEASLFTTLPPVVFSLRFSTTTTTTTPPPESREHLCDEQCKKATTFLFKYLSETETLLIGSRRSDGERCWRQVKCPCYFTIAKLRPRSTDGDGGGNNNSKESNILPSGVVSPHNQNKFTVSRILGGSKVGKLKQPPPPLVKTQQVTWQMGRSSNFQYGTINFWDLATRLGLQASDKKTKGHGIIHTGVWLCRDALGGPTLQDPLKQPKACSPLIVESFKVVSFAHAHRFSKMLHGVGETHSDWDKMECFDLHLGPLVTSLRSLGLVCGGQMPESWFPTAVISTTPNSQSEEDENENDSQGNEEGESSPLFKKPVVSTAVTIHPVKMYLFVVEKTIANVTATITTGKPNVKWWWVLAHERFFSAHDGDEDDDDETSDTEKAKWLHFGESQQALARLTHPETGPLMALSPLWDVDMVVCVGLKVQLEQGNFSDVAHYLGLGGHSHHQPHHYESDMRPLIHLESEGVDNQQLLTRAMSMNILFSLNAPNTSPSSNTLDFKLASSLANAVKGADDSKTCSLICIEDSIQLGLCTLGEAGLNTLDIVDRRYALQVDLELHPDLRGMPLSAPRSSVKNGYEGGRVVKNANLDREVFKLAGDLDYVQQYGSIIIELMLSPDQHHILPSLLKDLLEGRNKIKKTLATDLTLTPLQRERLQAKEQAIKLMSNKCSGWLGNRFPLLAAKMTARGRECLDNLMRFIAGRSVQVKHSETGEMIKVKMAKGCSTCSTIYADTDGVSINVTELGIKGLPGLYTSLIPLLQHQALRLTIRGVHLNFLPLGGKMYASKKFMPLQPNGEPLPRSHHHHHNDNDEDEDGGDAYDDYDLTGSNSHWSYEPPITSSLPHTTHLYPHFAKKLFDIVVSIMISGEDHYKVSAFETIRELLTTGLRGKSNSEFKLRLKVTSDLAPSQFGNGGGGGGSGKSISLQAKKLLSLMAHTGEDFPGQGGMIAYYRVIAEDGQHMDVTESFWNITTRALPLDIEHYVKLYIINPAVAYLALSGEGHMLLNHTWRLSQSDEKTVLFPPNCVLPSSM